MAVENRRSHSAWPSTEGIRASSVSKSTRGQAAVSNNVGSTQCDRPKSPNCNGRQTTRGSTTTPYRSLEADLVVGPNRPHSRGLADGWRQHLRRLPPHRAHLVCPDPPKFYLAFIWCS